MATEELTIRYPAGLERAVHLTKAEMEQHLRLMAALKMFELGKLSSGKAAELAGMSENEIAGMRQVLVQPQARQTSAQQAR